MILPSFLLEGKELKFEKAALYHWLLYMSLWADRTERICLFHEVLFAHPVRFQRMIWFLFTIIYSKLFCVLWVHAWCVCVSAYSHTYRHCPCVEEVCSIYVWFPVVSIKWQWQVTWVLGLRPSRRWCMCTFSINTIDIRSGEGWLGLSLGNICQNYYQSLRHGLQQTGQDVNEEGIVEGIWIHPIFLKQNAEWTDYFHYGALSAISAFWSLSGLCW